MIRAPEALSEARARLRAARVPDAGAEAEFLLASVLGLGRPAVRLADRPLTAAESRRLRGLLRGRLERRPLAYLLGSQPFLDLNLAVGPGVLIPRPETEELALAALEAARGKGPGLRVLDLCAGSGALALALASRLPGAHVTAADRSAAALAWARRNRRRHRLPVRLVRGDLFAPVAGERFDLIVANPPYLPTARLPRLPPEVRREPREALDGGPGGLAVLLRIVREASAHLRPGGILLLELDPGQAARVGAAMRRAGFRGVAERRDLEGRLRMVSGTWTG